MNKLYQIMDKIRSILLGGALGDALGAPHELVTYRGEYTGNLIYDVKINNRYYGLITLDVGCVTDDTQMTFELLRSLIKNNGLQREDLIKSYIQWADRRHESLGRNTRSLFRNIKTKDKLKSYETRRAKVDPNNQSNGSLMRTSALAFLPLDTLQYDDIVRREVKITNDHENNVQCSILHNKLLRTILNSTNSTLSTRDNLLQIVATFRDNVVNQDLKLALSQALSGEIRDIRGESKGWCCNSSYASIFALAHTIPSGTWGPGLYKDGVSSVIKMGGDTDTNAKIAGDLLGGLYGLDDEKNNIEIMMNCISNKDVLGDFSEILEKTHKLFNLRTFFCVNTGDRFL
jgi:ADP-ribosylglycohydrolase